MPGKPNLRHGGEDSGDDLTPARRIGSSKKRPANKLLTMGVTAVSLVVVVSLAWTMFGPSKKGPSNSKAGQDESVVIGEKKKSKSRTKKQFVAVDSAKPNAKVVACPVYTPEPGFYVLIDGEPARDDQGARLTTPCEVGLPAGNHTLTLVREKFRDYSEEVLIAQERTFDFQPVFEPFAPPTGYLASSLATAPVGKAVALKEVNTGGPAWDPFLSADGLSLWFAGQKDEGKGIFVSRRASITSEFGKPEMLIKNSDRAASPSVTEDQFVIAYAVRDKAQIRSLVRKEIALPFKQGPVLCFSERDGDRWVSSQISADGKKLFYIQERKGKTTGYVTTRKSLRKPFDDDPTVISLPGIHPRLSHDGLRQYSFDGEKLWRWARTAVADEFSKPELVCELELGNYTAHAGYRQFCVSEDEQWMYYSDAPEETGDLFAVRIAEGPQRGFVARGKAIAQKVLAQNSAVGGTAEEDSAKMPAKEKPPEDEPAFVDPRKLPLPYVAFRDRLEKLVTAYDLAAAEKLIGKVRQDPKFENDKTQLEWDFEEVQRLAKFWKRLEAAIADLKPGDVVRAGSIQLEFGKYEEGVFSGKVRGSDKTLTRTLGELAPVDLVTLVDKRTDRGDETAQLEIGTFLAMSPKASSQLVNSRLDRAGEKGKELLERQLFRKLHQIEQEIARENIGAGLQLADQFIASAPKSKAAAKARELRDALPLRIVWTPVGSQSWETSPPGEFTTTTRKAAGAYLISPAEYGNFVLTLEWKTSQDTAQGGVYFRYKRGADLRKNAFKIHIAGDHAIRANPDRFSTGSLFGIKGPRSNLVKPNGQWNTLVLRVENDRIKVTINGGDVLDTPASDPNIGSTGYICLDGEFGGITYRKVLVYEIPSAGPSKK